MPKRRPDFETELFRLWKVGRDDARDVCESTEKEFVIDYEGLKLQLVGFRQLRLEDNEVFFAWKIRHVEKMVLYYLRDKDSSHGRELLRGLKSAMVNHEFQDVEESLKSLYEQKHVLGRL